MNWYIDVLKKYAVFTGRAHRTEFWMFALFNFIIMVVLSIIEGILGMPGILSTLYCLGVLLPSIGVSIRRLHDTDRTGWWLLIALVPLIGIIILLVFYIMDSQEGENRFGPNPKAATV